MPFISAQEYLSYRYDVLNEPALLPLPDEPFTALWKEAAGEDALQFLSDTFKLPVDRFPLLQPDAIKIYFASTSGGRIPVISTGCHDDFCFMEALLDGRSESRELPLTINAFTMEAKAPQLHNSRLILLGNAPYSNVPGSALGLDEADWLCRSTALRLAHECTHYETLRLWGSMQNHALDEIAADVMGQLAAFGSFSAQRQRFFQRFFGDVHGRASHCASRHNLVPILHRITGKNQGEHAAFFFQIHSSSPLKPNVCSRKSLYIISPKKGRCFVIFSIAVFCHVFRFRLVRRFSCFLRIRS